MAIGAGGDPEKAAALGRELEEIGLEGPELLNLISWHILTDPDVHYRDRELALRLARRALELTEEKNANILDTYGRALYDRGRKEEAITYQRKAAAANPHDGEIAATLRRYLQETSARPPAQMEP